MTVDLDAYRRWDEKSQQKALDLLNEMDPEWRPFYCRDVRCDGAPHGDEWNFPHARSDQRPPNWSDPWLTLHWSSGRGTGKTMGAARLTNQIAEKVPSIALIGATGPDLRETMIEGPTGILAQAHPAKRPTWNPSRRRLEWPNGAVGRGFTAEEPSRIRGANVAFAWLDEPAHMDRIEEVWKNLMLTMRVKTDYPPHVLTTTTPLPIPWIIDLELDPRTIVVRVPTYANLRNLSDEFVENVIKPLEGTRWGRQELYGEVVTDIDGSLWKSEMFRYVPEPPEMDRIVVAVDPAGSANRRSDETGIVVLGQAGKFIYVLADHTGRYTPNKWATLATDAYESWKADAIIAEKNYGGDMVRSTLESANSLANVVLVDSRRGKQLRAEPIVSLYERGMVFHSQQGGLTELEREMTAWVPGKGASPNRIDAMVHGATDLTKRSGGMVSIADPLKVIGDKFRAPARRYLS